MWTLSHLLSLLILLSPLPVFLLLVHPNPNPNPHPNPDTGANWNQRRHFSPDFWQEDGVPSPYCAVQKAPKQSPHGGTWGGKNGVDVRKTPFFGVFSKKMSTTKNA